LNPVVAMRLSGDGARLTDARGSGM
jgi:hypothetical protein